ncbi:MAG: 2'-5' RNA ligase family protein [Candidatus Curtissbacteria bacterium]|nr:2'-5' RNA ligase family protein [Candidatus Curtissbacteria bacterium]
MKVKEYTSCFIGIPLPEEYQQDFESLLVDVSQIEPLLETTYPKTPHITGYYLDKQSQFKILNIAENVKSKIGLLKGVKLTVGGFGYFGGDDPKVIFLNVRYTEALKEFNDAMTGSLSEYCAPDNNLPSHPHMTVGRMRIPKVQQSFKKSVSILKNRLNKLSWTFPVTEVVLYGVDSTQSPQYQEKLISISVR